MKKGIALLLALVLALSVNAMALAAAGEIALITDLGNIDDQSFNQGTWEGIGIFAEAMGMDEDTYVYYRPSEDSDEARMEQILTAIENGASTIVLPGYLFDTVIQEAQETFSDVNFLCVDMSADASYTANTVNLVYSEEVAGYVAGYAAVMDGYTQLAFLGGLDVPAVVRYGFGFVQGADDAAVELDVDVQMNYWYSGSFAATPEIQGKTDAWYANGTEVIFACGGGIVYSAQASADLVDGKLIGVDVDQYYLSDGVITSAMKDLRGSVSDSLTKLYENDGVWPEDMGGTTITMDAASGAVGLPTDEESWRMDTFTVEAYEELYAMLQSGEIVVSNDIAEQPAVERLVVDYQN